MKKEKHILVYGYSTEDTQKIKSFIENKLNINLIIISASSKESVKIGDIIEGGEVNTFIEKEDKVLMFLDFLDEEIRLILFNFSDTNAKKPLFCVLTEHNISWTIIKLIEDLIEERKYFEEMKRTEKRNE